MDQKKLDEKDLEKVSGGTPYLGSGEPGLNNFAYHVGDIIDDFGQFIDGNYFDGKSYKVVAIGKLYTGGNAYVKGYNLLYKLEITDRNYSHLDGWYDLQLDIHPWYGTVIGRHLVRVSEAGIVIVQQ